MMSRAWNGWWMWACAAVLLLVGLTGTAAAAPPARVRLETSLGPIVVELAERQAPITSANFLRYVKAGRLDGTTFYRAAPTKWNARIGLIQGGINHRVVRAFPPIAHEPTSRTGLRHIDGTLSMARNEPGSAMGDFFITVGPAAYLDARPGNVGYAAFGRVVSGMPLVHRILAMPKYPGGYSKVTIGQSLREPVKIISAKRIR